MKFKELREKTLTPAEKKKREEIAKAIEKDDPDMPMDKKMAIATAQAKKVAEAKKLDEISPKLARKAAASSAAKSFEYGSSAYGPGADKEADRLDKKSDKARAHVQKRQGDKGVKKVDRLTGKLVYGRSRAFEEVEMTEAVDYFKVAKAFDDYAKKSGGIDKKDFMKVGAFVRQLGKESDVNKQDKTFVAMQKFIRLMDTDPRDGVIQIFQKHGMYKDGRIMRESVEEAMGPRPPKLKGNSGPYTRQQIEKAAKEAKVDIGAKSRMMMALRKM